MFAAIAQFIKKTIMQPSPAAGKRILIIEDGEVERAFMSKTLCKKGFKVFMAPDGEEGVKMAKELVPDLVILDFKLPGINGDEVCSLIKNEPVTQRIPVLFLTGSTNNTELIECYEVGADHYLTKPISAMMLLKQIELTFETHQKRDE